MEQDLCHICGEPATNYFASSQALPLCDNYVCYHTTTEELNLLLADAANEQKEKYNNEPSFQLS